MAILLDVPFSYAASVVPKKARKPRDVELVSTLPLLIREIPAGEAPVVLEAEVEHEYVAGGAFGSEGSGWKRTMHPVVYRSLNGRLLRPFDLLPGGYPEAPPPFFSVSVREAPAAMAAVLQAMIVGVASPMLPWDGRWRETEAEDGFAGRVVSSLRVEEAARLASYVEDAGLVVLDGGLWRRTDLPVWEVGFEHIEKGRRHSTGKRRYLRAIAESRCGPDYGIRKLFHDKRLADVNFARMVGEERKYAEASRDAYETAPDRGRIDVVGPLPFGRDDRSILIREHLEALSGDRHPRTPGIEAAIDVLMERTAVPGGDPDPAGTTVLLAELSDLVDHLHSEIKGRHWNMVADCLELLRLFDGVAAKAQPDIAPTGHRARRANGVQVVPRQALVSLAGPAGPVLVSRKDAARLLEDGPAEVPTWSRAFDVDGSPAFAASGSVVPAHPPETVGEKRGLSDLLADRELDRLALCDWETWRRGAGTVMRPSGTGGMAARVWFRRHDDSVLYVFPLDGSTWEAFVDVATLGEAKRLCEAALEEHGRGRPAAGDPLAGVFDPKRPPDPAA